MTGSGLGNFGLGGMGIYGQQEWQKKSQEDELARRIQQTRWQLGPQAQVDPMLQAKAQFEAARGMYGESGGTASAFGSSMMNYMEGAVARGMMQKYPQGPAAGEQGQQDWWNKAQSFRFPDTGGKRY
jgi:hypothetical protein